MNRQLARADGRPRVHLWPRRDGLCERSMGPVGGRYTASSMGLALEVALAELGPGAAAGVVVIVEPVP